VSTRLNLHFAMDSTCRKCRCVREAYYGRVVATGRRVMFFRTHQPCACGCDIVVMRPRVSVSA